MTDIIITYDDVRGMTDRGVATFIHEKVWSALDKTSASSLRICVCQSLFDWLAENWMQLYLSGSGIKSYPGWAMILMKLGFPPRHLERFATYKYLIPPTEVIEPAGKMITEKRLLLLSGRWYPLQILMEV